MTERERPHVSCYIRTLNEETRIAAAVRAALPVACEVIVVDPGSIDGTAAAAEAAGARVVVFEAAGFRGEGSEARRRGRLPA